MKRLTKIFIIFCILCTYPIYAQKQKAAKPVTQNEYGVNDTKATEILNKTKAWFNSQKALQADFTYSIEHKAKNISQQKSGKILISGNKFCLHIMGMEIYCDGKVVWNYSPDSKELSINEYNASSDENMNPLSIIENYEKSYRAKYIKEENIGGKAREIIDLTPIKSASFHKMRLYLNKADKQLYKTEVYDKNGSVYAYTIKKFTHNPKINAQSFTFDPKKYPEIEINDMR